MPLPLLTLLLALSSSLPSSLASPHTLTHSLPSTSSTLYIGSYSSSIARILLSPSGHMQLLGHSPAELNPSWLVFNSHATHLFAVSEVGDYVSDQYPGSGAISSYSVQHEGELELVSTVASGGSAPAHATLDKTDSCLYVSNYCAGA
jgi:6-phosphogluconolactonase (cycloisomerase 2 family)